jgi:hypothetical protein
MKTRNAEILERELGSQPRLDVNSGSEQKYVMAHRCDQEAQGDSQHGGEHDRIENHQREQHSSLEAIDIEIRLQQDRLKTLVWCK